jgi:Lrp/AsnC family transcriptional regulator
MNAEGVIQRRVALLSPEALGLGLGLGLTVFVSIEAGDHSPEWLDRFAATVADLPEVVEVHRMAGDIDYMLRVVALDVAAYDRFYKRLRLLLGSGVVRPASGNGAGRLWCASKSGRR